MKMNFKKTTGFDQSLINDPFFDSLKTDYEEFVEWYKASENDKNKTGYYWYHNGGLSAFIGVKVEEETIELNNITLPKRKRLKITTIKSNNMIPAFSEFVVYHSIQSAIKQGIDEIYFSVIPNTDEKRKLSEIFESYGFEKVGTRDKSKNSIKRSAPEDYMLKKLSNSITGNWKKDYPKVGFDNKEIKILPIIGVYHDEYLQDATLYGEKDDVNPYKMGIKKSYVHSMYQIRNLNEGSILLIYKMGPDGTAKKYTSVITSVGVVVGQYQKGKDFTTFEEFKKIIKKSHAFANDDELMNWYESNKYITVFSHNIAFGPGNNVSLKFLQDNSIVQIGQRPQEPDITPSQLKVILKEGGKNV